jgi:hypothetical protein
MAFATVAFRPGHNGRPATDLPASMAARPPFERLSDGTRVEFNSGAEIATDFTATDPTA